MKLFERCSVAVFIVMFFVVSPVLALSDQTGALIDGKVDEIAQDVIKLVAEGLKIQSISNPEYPEEMTGGKQWPAPIKEMLSFALDTGKSLGLRAVNMDDKTGYLEIGPEDAKEMIMVLGHLDTVGPSNVAKWEKDPFSGTIADGKIYGRGATDDKAPTLSAIYALKVVHDLGIPLKHRVRLLFGTDEERPYWYGVNYYKNNGGELPLWGFTPDAGIALQEKGIMNGWPRMRFDDSQSDTYMESFVTPGSVYNSVCDNTVVKIKVTAGDTADARAAALKTKIAPYPILDSTDITVENGDTLVIKNNGKPGHGASPHGINAISRTLVVLSLVDTNAKWRDAAEVYLKVFPEDLTVDSASKPSAEVDGKTLGIDKYKETHFGSESPVTLNIGFSEWTSSDAFITINTRYPHPTGGVTANERQEQIRKSIEDAFIAAKIDVPNVEPSFPASLFAEDHYLVTAMKRVGLQLDGVEPSVSKNRGGATYIKAFPDRMMSFGSVTGGGGHGYNEYCTQDSVVRVTKLIARGVAELAGSDVSNAVPGAVVSSDVPLFTNSAELTALVSDTLKLNAGDYEVVAARKLTAKNVAEKFDIRFEESSKENAKGSYKVYFKTADGTYKEIPVVSFAATVVDRTENTPNTPAGDAPYDADATLGVVEVSYIVLK